MTPAALVAGVMVVALGVAGRRAFDRRAPVRSGSWANRVRKSSPGWLGLRPVARPGPPSGEVLRLRASLASGNSVALALRDLATGSGAWAEPAGRAVRRIDAGAGVGDALDAWASEAGDPSITLMADALVIALESGGSLERSLDAVLVTLRERAELAREVRALSSQARTSAWVLVATPGFFAVALAVADHRVRAFYVASPLGIACVVLGVALDASGAWWMSKLVGRVR